MKVGEINTTDHECGQCHALPGERHTHKQEHEYDGRHVMRESACIHCGFKPWVDHFRECREQ